MLHPVISPPPRTKAHTWCGPAALSIITGREYETCRAVIASITERPVLGVSPHTMILALHHFGYVCERRVPRLENPTLAQWLRSRQGGDLTTTFLVCLSNHWIVVRGRKACDNHVKAPVFVSEMRLRRARVERIIAVTKRAPKGDPLRENFVRMITRLGGSYAMDPTGAKLTVRAKRGSKINGWQSKTFTEGNLWQTASQHLTLHAKAA